MVRISYWIIPVVSGATWLGLLLGMIIGWVVDAHREHYVSMDADQDVPYISDIGASPRFKPVFIALCAVTTATLDLSFLADRWLRHAGRLTPNGTRGQKVLAVLAILFGLVGTAGLILLSVFDVAHHKSLHDGFLLCFLGGYVLSAIFICWEYQRLGMENRHLRILRVSFWIKLSFVLIEVVLAIAFVSLTFTHHTTGGAIVEWIIAFIFAFYVFSFCIDLYPATRTHGHHRVHGAHANGIAEKQTHGSAATADTEPGVAAPDAAYTANGYTGDVYASSAARATRAPRSTAVPTDANFENNSSAGSDGQPLTWPLHAQQPAFEPGRAY